MKKVIFVCLLTLSVCLSDTNVTSVNPGNSTKSGNETVPATTAATTPAPAPSTAHPTDSKNNETKPQDTVKPTQNTTEVAPAPEKNNATNTNSTDGKPDKVEKTTVKPAEHSTPNATAAAPTTDKATTMKPPATTVQPHTLQARGFDGASFVGGIILTLGLIAIGFMGFKYYKAQTERNYHTL